MLPTECDKFPCCNCALCPLGTSPSDTGIHLESEPVCPYLLGSGKVGAQDYYAGDPVFPVVLQKLPEIVETYPSIQRAIEKASRSGFRGQHLRKNATLAPSALG